MIEFIPVKPGELLNQAVARYEGVSGETLYPGDEHYLFLSQMVQLIVACQADINTAANQNLLRYCTGSVLDEYGRQYGLSRIPAQTVSASVKFLLTSALGFDVTVPKGTRVTPDGQLVFFLQAAAVIPAGQTEGRGIVLAESAGAAYNGFLPGQIQSFIDPADYVASVANVTVSAGGADQEDDDSFRERIRLSWEAISTAGSKESYEYWAKTASLDIADTEAVRTAAGEVTVYVLMKDAVTPPQSILDAVNAVCGEEKHRPLTDKVIVSPARAKTYDINLTYYVSAARSTELPAIQAAVDQAVSAYVSEQQKKLGGNLNPDSLRNALYAAGVYRIDITSPAYTELLPQEVAVIGSKTVVYGGLL